MTEPTSTASSRRRWPWVVLAIVALLVVAAAVAVPLLLDVERHRGRIEAALADATGWNAELGDLDVALLRGLAVTVNPVRLDSPDTESSFDAETIEIRGALLPLLRGRLEIRTVRFLRPRFELVRTEADQDWDLPIPEDPGAASGDPEEAEPGLAVSVDLVSIEDGTFRLVDRSVEPPWTTELGGIDLAFRPPSGDVTGEAALGDGGKVAWSGNLSEIALDLEDVPTGLLTAWVGEELVRPGGLVSGDVNIALPAGVEGELDLRNVQVLAGEEAYETAALEFAVGARDAGWDLERLSLAAEGATLTAKGSLSPDLDLRLELPSTGLESTLEFVRGIFPLALDLTPPGRASAVIDVKMPAGGELTYSAAGEIAAARFLAGDFLPAATDVATSFRLSPEGSLDLQLEQARVGGGPLTGTVTIDSLEPLGQLVFEGRLADAGLGELLGGIVADAPRRIAGPVGLEARMIVDLGAAVIDAGALKGRLELKADQVTLPGWDLETAVRSKLDAKLRSLEDLSALVQGKDSGEDVAAEAVEVATRLVDRLGAAIEFDSLPWRFQRLELAAGHVEAGGQGTFDPLAGKVDVRVAARLDAELTARYLKKYSFLRSLVAADGRIAVPLKIRGPLMQPSLDVDLGELSPIKGKKPKEALKGLLEGLID